MPVGYVSDTFAHVAQLPQILRGFGIDSFVFMRGMGDEGEKLRVQVVCPGWFGGPSNPPDPRQFQLRSRDNRVGRRVREE